jgi:hypothetical protein
MIPLIYDPGSDLLGDEPETDPGDRATAPEVAPDRDEVDDALLFEIRIAVASLRNAGRPRSVLHALIDRPEQSLGELAGRLLQDPVQVEHSLNVLQLAGLVVETHSVEGDEVYSFYFDE